MQQQITYSTKYALLTPTQYAELNTAISSAFGFNEGENTERYTTTEPEMLGELCIMIITGEVQERFSYLLAGVELVEKIK